MDGVSLTVNRVAGASFELNIVPHTLQETTIGGYRPGRRVNLEVDVIARYLERLFPVGGGREKSSGITTDFLKGQGFFS